MAGRPQLRLIRGGQAPLPDCSTKSWRDHVTHTYRMLQWSDEQGPVFSSRVVHDALTHHGRALAAAGWRLRRYDDIKTHHRAIRARQVSDVTVHTRCLGNGSAQTLLDVRTR